MACHVIYNVPPTIQTHACFQAPKPAFAFTPQQLQVCLLPTHLRQQRLAPQSPEVIYFRLRDCRTGHVSNILACHVMETLRLHVGVRYEHSDTVLGSTGKHPHRLGVIVECPQAHYVRDDRGVPLPVNPSPRMTRACSTSATLSS